MSTEQTPEELGYAKPVDAGDRYLSNVHMRVLCAAERGEHPDTRRYDVRMAQWECRRWGLVYASETGPAALTPAGVEALRKKRRGGGA